MDKKTQRKLRRKKSIRKKIYGTEERPRLCIHRTNKNIYAQVVNDVENKTICGVSTMGKELTAAAITRKNMKFASKVGEKLAKLTMEKGVQKVVFDRAGYKYHGVVKALAEAARKGGLQF
jgi:large subunit ribosomal protein L18